MVIKYTNIFHCKTLQNLPRLGFLVWKQTIWQPWWSDQNVTLSVVEHSMLLVNWTFSGTCKVKRLLLCSFFYKSM
jgi:hypothetical protein